MYSTNQNKVAIGNVEFCNYSKFTLIAGPCQLESLEHSIMIGEAVKKICQKYDIHYVFKASFDKANRTSVAGKRGVGIDNAKEIFTKLKETLQVPLITDVHSEGQCEEIAPFIDIIQIPAFLCRQTDLLLTAGNTGKVINVKKGQFMAPADAKNIVTKIKSTGNDKIILTERGVSFGYNNLVSDMRGLYTMAEDSGCPVIFDATHSTQQPGGCGTSSGGDRKFAPILARAALASSPIAGIFAEVHQDPDNAPSDGPSMIVLSELENIIKGWLRADGVNK
jgi:2-dehydro-3-deoxyphosphooctonate aldolase (KDO 8-P synthase)